MGPKPWSRWRGACGVTVLSLCAAAAGLLAGQTGAPGKERAEDVAGFKEFSDRVQAYVKLQRRVGAALPALKPTDLPEMITAHQAALARRIREARPHAKPGEIFTPAACEAFRHASRTALLALPAAGSGADIKADAPNPGMRLAVNDVYPDTEPVTALSPGLLAAFPPLPAEVAYRVVGRTLMLVDLRSRLVIDFARLVLPPPS